MTKITPIGERLLIKQHDPLKQIGNIIIPESAQEKPSKGQVIALGQLDNDAEWPLKVGDEIMFAQNAGTEINENGDTYRLIGRRDVLVKY